MSKNNNGASNALVQGSILAVASIISRIIGLIYRIPMQRMIDATASIPKQELS